MKIIGCDFHTRYQQIAMMDEATGELTERRLDHENGEADAFCRDLGGWPTFELGFTRGSMRTDVVEGSERERHDAAILCAKP